VIGSDNVSDAYYVLLAIRSVLFNDLTYLKLLLLDSSFADY
jgi:hypothetical protein